METGLNVAIAVSLVLMIIPTIMLGYFLIKWNTESKNKGKK